MDLSQTEAGRATTQLFIKKCSIFDFKQSKPLIDSVKEIVEGSFADSDLSVRSPKKDSSIDLNQVKIELNDKLTVSDKLHCTTCNQSFSNREEQIEHYKGDLHLFNMKQKLKSKPIVTADQFEELSDISSISGSDSDELREEDSASSLSTEEDDSTRPNYARVAQSKPKITIKLADSTLLVMHRVILHGKKNVPEDEKTLLDTLKSIKQDDHWCIILVAAGHFAAAIFKGDTVVMHKTFHKYVIRAKRGTVQSQHDSSGKHAKSAGANIRRAQEASFKDDIRALLGTQWKADLDKCKCVFIRVPAYNKPVLIQTTSQNKLNNQESAPFSRDDTRLRHIPFMTFRPTFNEVKRAHSILSKLELYNESYLNVLNKYQQQIKSPVSNESTTSSKQKTKTKKTKSKKVESEPIEATSKLVEVDDEEAVEEENKNEEILEESGPECKTTANDFIQSLTGDELKLFNEIYTACSTNNVNKLTQLLDSTTKESSLENETKHILVEKLLNKRLNKDKGFTLLHLTSELGHAECIWHLLLNGADPALADLTKHRRLPYFIASSKSARDQFRRFMNDFPNRYDYKVAKITSPLSQEQMNEKLEKEKEKKRNQRKKKQQREAQIKKQEKQVESEQAEKERFLSLTDQEKRKLIVDRNFLNIMPINEDAHDTTKVKYSPQQIKNICRCWTCGADMSTSVPFEYFDYKFCSTKCLKIHREKTAIAASKK